MHVGALCQSRHAAPPHSHRLRRPVQRIAGMVQHDPQLRMLANDLGCFLEVPPDHAQIPGEIVFAQQIQEPLLLLHGAQDGSAGTPALQSERLYQALAGLGKPVRLALLPLEGHQLASREAAGHVQWEMSSWLRRHLGEPKGR